MLQLAWDLRPLDNAAEARALLGNGVRILARHTGPEWSFAAADLSANGITIRRSAVLCQSGGSKAALLFDIASAPFTWGFGGSDVRVLRPPAPGFDVTSAIACTQRAELLKGVDLLGAAWQNWAVLFHTGLTVAHSSLSFDASSGTRYLLTGLGPGYWDVWRDGWLDEIGLPVRPQHASLRFDSNPGSFFIRKFG